MLSMKSPHDGSDRIQVTSDNHPGTVAFILSWQMGYCVVYNEQTQYQCGSLEEAKRLIEDQVGEKFG